jgi:hypothetical protein
MKTTVRIAALMLLIVFSALPSNTGAQSTRTCICPAVFDPHCDATGRTFSNGCVCRCLSAQPDSCKRCGNTVQ